MGCQKRSLYNGTEWWQITNGKYCEWKQLDRNFFSYHPWIWLQRLRKIMLNLGHGICFPF